VLDRRVVVVIVVAVAVILSAVAVTLTYRRHSVEAHNYWATLLQQPNLLAPFGIKAYVSEEALKHINVSAIELLGLGVSQFRFPDVPRVEDGSIVVLHVDDFKNSKPEEAFAKLDGATANRSRFIIIVLNTARDTEATRTTIDVMLKLYRSRHMALVLPLDPRSISDDKLVAPQLHEAVYSAEALAFTFNPTGVVVVKNLIDFRKTLVMLAKWGGLLTQNIFPSAITDAQLILHSYNWTHIGYIGWITASTMRTACYETTAIMYIKVDYYHASVTTLGGKTYHKFMAYVEHDAEDYSAQCCMQPCWQVLYPETFISETNWMTTSWPGQVLDDWEPKNAGISIVPNAPYYEWFDMTDPAAGIVISKYVVKLPGEYPIYNLTGVIFGVESASIAFLDPDRPGGVSPMMVKHEFVATLNTGDTVTISFSASLYPTTVINH